MIRILGGDAVGMKYSSGRYRSGTFGHEVWLERFTDSVYVRDIDPNEDGLQQPGCRTNYDFSTFD